MTFDPRWPSWRRARRAWAARVDSVVVAQPSDARAAVSRRATRGREDSRRHREPRDTPRLEILQPRRATR